MGSIGTDVDVTTQNEDAVRRTVRVVPRRESRLKRIERFDRFTIR